jgi:valyl-tRNA synthetase
LQDPPARTTAQRVLAHTLDVLVRLLHPLIPFITEEVWQLLGQTAPTRGLSAPQRAVDSVMTAAWPVADASRQDSAIEARFARFQEVLKALRDVRGRQNIPPKKPIRFAVQCDPATAELLQPMEPYFTSMAGAEATAWGPQVKPPATSVGAAAGSAEVFVDMAGHIDAEAEKARQTKELARLDGAIAAKQRQLANENFVSRAPAAVIEKERAALAQLQQSRASAEAALEKLQSAKK